MSNVRVKGQRLLLFVLVGLAACQRPLPQTASTISDDSTGPNLPREVYLEVLDSVAMRARAARQPVFFDTSPLPASITPADLRSRGFRPRDRSYRCGVHGTVYLRPPVYHEGFPQTGTYRIDTVEWLPPPGGMASDYHYWIRCSSSMCKVTAAQSGLGDLVTGCPVSR